jgi:hypothetical protein
MLSAGLSCASADSEHKLNNNPIVGIALFTVRPPFCLYSVFSL